MITRHIVQDMDVMHVEDMKVPVLIVDMRKI